MTLLQGQLAVDQHASVTASPSFGRFAESLAPFVGHSKNAKAAWRSVEQAAPRDHLVTLAGEIGTGKSLLARHLHWQGPRAPLPCERVDFRRMPAEIIESELFGYQHSGLLGRHSLVQGRVESAGHGTMILTGLETLSRQMQEHLLPWLFEGSYQPVGVAETRQSGARVVVEWRAREFPRARETSLIPPLYRLFEKAVVSLDPLHQRREDIVPLLEYYLHRNAVAWGRGECRLAHETERLVRRGTWRRNGYDLVAASGFILSHTESEVIAPAHLPPAVARRAEEAASIGLVAISLEEMVEQKLGQFFARLGAVEMHDLYPMVMDKVERPLMQRVLQQTGGNQVRAARLLGINRNTLRSRLRKLGLHVVKEKL